VSGTCTRVRARKPGLARLTRLVPASAERCDSMQNSDVTVDARGLVYLIDGQRGLTIVERI